MLKRIVPTQVELGMFIHSLEGSWLQHPFWRSSFLLEDPDQLAELRAARLDAVVIDTARGRDLVPQRAIETVSAMRAPVQMASFPPRRIMPPQPPAPPARLGLQQLRQREFGNAARVADRAGKLVSRAFYEARLGRAVKACQIEPVVDDIFSSIQHNPHAFNGLMRCRRDNAGLFQHALAVCGLMVTLARRLQFDPAGIRAAGMAGLLIDVGAGLTQADPEDCHVNPGNPALREHPKLGHDFLCAGGAVPEEVAVAVLEHHEFCDGSGYPRGLQGQDISLLGRMVSICSNFDDLSNNASSGGGPGAAIEAMKANARLYDRPIFEIFCEVMGLYPIGTVVLLHSGRLALVVDQPHGGRTVPRLRAFYSTASNQRLTAVDVELEGENARDAIVALADPAAYGLVDFARLRDQLFAGAHAR